MLFHCNDSDFEQKVLKSRTIVLVDFYADWCGPCQMLAPTIEELGEDYAVCKVNVDEAPGIAMRYNVQSIPTLMVFSNGNVINHAVGYREREEILELMGL